MKNIQYAIFELQMNLSQEERTELVRRVDIDGDGIITLEELQLAFQQGESVSTPVEKKAAGPRHGNAQLKNCTVVERCVVLRP